MAIGNPKHNPNIFFYESIDAEHLDKFTSQNLCLHKIDKII